MVELSRTKHGLVIVGSKDVGRTNQATHEDGSFIGAVGILVLDNVARLSDKGKIPRFARGRSRVVGTHGAMC